MLGRLFGKNKDTSGEAVCNECGRTLLAGEWTQKIEDDNGSELLLCSLCGQAHPPADGERLQVKSGASAARPAGQDVGGADGRPSARAEPERDENAALWKAIKDRDAQIESLQRRACPRRGRTSGTARPPGPSAGRSRGGRADPEVAATDAPADAEAPRPTTAAEQGETEPDLLTDADLFTLADETVAAPVDEESQDAARAAADAAQPVAAEDTAEILAADVEAEAAPDATEAEAGPPSEAEAETAAALEAEAQATSMTLLQRGVDLLNVSPVPRKIAETNADLGIPTVHVGFDGEVATVTFMWSMGWYRFAVDVESGSVSLGDRGYEERDDLQPNASVRADGTVQLAAARISRAAAQRAQSAPDAGAVADPVAAEPPPVETPEPEVAPPAGGPEILSKSLLGQRTDDERPSWEQTQARDFDWDH